MCRYRNSIETRGIIPTAAKNVEHETELGLYRGFMVFLGLLYLEDSVVVEIGFNAGHSCLLMLLAHPKLQVTQLYDAALNPKRLLKKRVC